MKKILSVIVATAVATMTAAAQSGGSARYIVNDSVTLSAAAETLTVQQPASGAKQVSFELGTVYCSVACTATLSQNGTAASATGATPTPINPAYKPASAAAYKGSNVGAGTTLSTYAVSAGATFAIDLSKISLGATGGTNLSLAVSSITGSAILTLIWNER
jgi:hypothetical protein